MEVVWNLLQTWQEFALYTCTYELPSWFGWLLPACWLCNHSLSFLCIETVVSSVSKALLGFSLSIFLLQRPDDSDSNAEEYNPSIVWAHLCFPLPKLCWWIIIVRNREREGGAGRGSKRESERDRKGKWAERLIMEHWIFPTCFWLYFDNES